MDQEKRQQSPVVAIVISIVSTVGAAILLFQLKINSNGEPIDSKSLKETLEEQDDRLNDKKLMQLKSSATFRAWSEKQQIDRITQNDEVNREYYVKLSNLYSDIDLKNVDVELATLIQNKESIFRKSIRHFDRYHKNNSSQTDECKPNWESIRQERNTLSALDKEVALHLSTKYNLVFLDEN